MAVFILLFIFIPIDLPQLKSNYSFTVYDESGKLLRIYLNKKEQYCFPLKDNNTINPKLEKAVICFEDKYFFYHFGINPFSLFRALWLNITKGKIVSGGSTITMQLARIMNNSPRTYLNKIKEIFMALKLELYLSKTEILKLYLAHAPYGGNLRGVKAATFKYFGKEHLKISWAEAATLAVLPNSPGKITPFKNRNFLIKKRNKLLKKLYNQKIISQEDLNLAKDELLSKTSFKFPFIAPHFIEFVKKSTKNLKKSFIQTTMNYDLQQNIEEITSTHASKLKSQNINNCSVLVLDSHTGNIKSYIGSADYYDSKNNGQVDGVISFRSSGSTLKPFLYALALDEGLLVSESKLLDIPAYFGAFSPANSSNTYGGLVTASDALIRSLNVPAVYLLQEYGLYKFYNYLKDSGIRDLYNSAERYGLTLIVGGAEVRMLDLANLYLNLASFNSPKTLRYLKNDTVQSSAKSLISKGASYLTLEMLRKLKRPENEMYWNYFDSSNKIAWKTGTSFGGKDAWACGVTPDWVVLVWAGNFSGEGIPNVSGRNTTAPLMFNIFNYLFKKQDSKWFEYPDKELKEIFVSKFSGYRLLDKYRDKCKIALQPQKAKSLKLSIFEQNVFLNKKGEEVCSCCWDYAENQPYDTLLIIYPPQLNQYLTNMKLQTRSYPLHRLQCPSVKNKITPKIIYPPDGAFVYLPIDLKGEKQSLVLQATHNIKSEKLYWHLNNKFIGSTVKKHKFKIKLSRGKYALYITDSKGSSVKSKFTILDSSKE